MTSTYWQDPADYPNAREERERELLTEIDTTRYDLEQAEKTIATLQAKVENMTSLLEEILEHCQDNYDVDPDPSGGHHDVPNWYMRTGTEIEDVLGRGGRYGL